VGHFAKINFKNVTIFLSMAWDRVSTDTIKNCFAKAFKSCRNYELASVDNNDPPDKVAFQTMEEIVNEHSGLSESSDTIDSNDLGAEIKNVINTLKIIDTITRRLAHDSLKQFCMFRIKFLSNLRKRQGFRKKITDYFHK